LRNFAHFVHAAHEIQAFRENIFRPSICRFGDRFESRQCFRDDKKCSRRASMPQSIDLKNVHCA
jgi:hypothetical protein